jgi:hypothetical protein
MIRAQGLAGQAFHQFVPEYRLNTELTPPIFRRTIAAWQRNQIALIARKHNQSRQGRKNLLPSLTGLGTRGGDFPSHEWLGYYRMMSLLRSLVHS